MADLTEDFNDATYVTPIAGTWTRVTTDGRSGGYLSSGEITSTEGTRTATITIPTGATSVRLWGRGESLGAEGVVFQVNVNGGSAYVFASTGAWIQSPAISLVGATTLTVTMENDGFFPNESGIDDMVFTIPDAASAFSGWGIPI